MISLICSIKINKQNRRTKSNRPLDSHYRNEMTKDEEGDGSNVLRDGYGPVDSDRRILVLWGRHGIPIHI